MRSDGSQHTKTPASSGLAALLLGHVCDLSRNEASLSCSELDRRPDALLCLLLRGRVAAPLIAAFALVEDGARKESGASLLLFLTGRGCKVSASSRWRRRKILRESP